MNDVALTLTAIKAALDRCTHDLVERECACADGMCPLCLRADLAAARAEAARLRERHAAAVERAWYEAWDAAQDYDRDIGSSAAKYAVNRDAAWLASEAKARLT